MPRYNAIAGRCERLPDEHARPYFHRLADERAQLQSFTPPQMASRYSFPAGDGAGRKIAIIELGGGFIESALRPYWQQIGVAAPKLFSHSVNGGTNAPGDDADGEVCLDVCVIGGIVPAAELHVIFAPNTSDSFVAAQRYSWQALKADACSISWGGPERGLDAYATSFRQSIIDGNAAGMSTHVAAGDNDQGDGAAGVNADFPGSIPEAFCWGGTRINPDGSEVVWNTQPGREGTGGGFSRLFNRPTWQDGLTSSTMALRPDFSGMADPANGWVVSVNGSIQAIGGTSAVAPMGAALFALLLNSGVKPTHENLYAARATFGDVLIGNNN